MAFRYCDLRKQIEDGLAERLWGEARDQDVNVLTYTVPKGEMGILPTELRQSKFFDCDFNKVQQEDVKLRIDAKLSFGRNMRDPY